MNDRYAVMDLGTNTFHLLIAEAGNHGFNEIVHEEEPVKLGEGGINKGYIVPAAFERGIKTMEQFSELIKNNNVQQVRAIATSALRSAANGEDFIRQVKEKTGIAIEIINGDQEAAFIYKGVKASGCLTDENSLIVDIGGGSVEFIICNDNNVYWKQSFEIGAARLMDKFHRTDPIPPESINALNLYLEDQLQSLFEAIKTFPVHTLIGSSGSFESYTGLIETAKGHAFDLKKIKSYEFNMDELLKLMEQVILSTHQERIENPGIITVRKDMIVTASILARFILEKLKISTVMMTTHSLKEGVLAEMMG
ncbi:exopolyphosphatase [uncultured Mucilaginibacter sp.]|uniref:Ppx/GppA phosphatase family protein n=1 Tax=uncultured Mucilaginibacter sp. TaxID=797541 RepID=UPI0025E6875B|nr:exopolyphosphatase [uncultured Mucilaginibacter sp.]